MNIYSDRFCRNPWSFVEVHTDGRIWIMRGQEVIIRLILSKFRKAIGII
jgi:hypothetical protein